MPALGRHDPRRKDRHHVDRHRAEVAGHRHLAENEIVGRAKVDEEPFEAHVDTLPCCAWRSMGFRTRRLP